MSRNILDEENFYSFLKECSKEEIIFLYKEIEIYLKASYLLAPVMEELFEDMKIIIANFFGTQYIDELVKNVESLDPDN